jgi:DNA helicase HerA-like ATPase
VLGQLGHRVQHALRAFTPRDQKAVRVARKHSARIRRSTPKPCSRSSRSARRSFRCWMKRASRRSSSAR